MNKNRIRLTEAQLHKVIKESVNKILKEYGEHNASQYQLGRLAARQKMQGRDNDANNTFKYAHNARQRANQNPNAPLGYDKELANSNANGWHVGNDNVRNGYEQMRNKDKYYNNTHGVQ